MLKIGRIFQALDRFRGETHMIDIETERDRIYLVTQRRKRIGFPKSSVDALCALLQQAKNGGC